MKSARMLVVGFAVLGLWVVPSQAQVSQGPRNTQAHNGIVVPYEPSPDNVVDAMLAIGGVKPGDFVVDLGSGDGRIVITAAKKFGARGFGVDLDRDLVQRSIANARAGGVADQVTFYQQDIFKTDLSQATVVTMFLFPHINLKLRPKLLDLKAGTRIVSHFHDMADWRPDRQQRLMTTEHYGDTWVFMWYVPAKVAGSWEWVEPRSGEGQRHTLMLNQKFQEVDGSLTTDTLRPIAIRDAKLQGAHLTFWVPIRESGRTMRWDFEGDVDAESGVITGVEGAQGLRGRSDRPWRATRSAP